jgi:hypothetical protein
VWALFLVFSVAFTYGSREFVRELLERRWRAGIGLKRVLIAGAGDLGRLVADRILQHRELGYQVIGFIDDRAGGDHIGYRGLPLLGTLAEVADIAQRERIDHLYVALALDEHPKLLDLMDTANRECIDVKVVPDLLQFIALRARLEDLDGLPVINVNDVPLQGFNAWVKRALDILLSAAAPPSWPCRSRRWCAGPRRERCSTARSGWGSTAAPSPCSRSARYQNAETRRALCGLATTTRARRWVGRAAPLRPRRAAAILERAQGDMSIVAAARAPLLRRAVQHRIRSMLRQGQAGITGWAGNGWRGNTSLEKRIEFDLSYIENWSVTLDIKIMWLTLVRGLFQRSPAV